MNQEEQKRIFAMNLTNLVSASGKMQKEIAEDLGIKNTTFNNWCKGIALPTVSKIQMLADYFKVGKSALVDEPNGYYVDDKVADLAQFLATNPEYQVLFDASRKVKKQDIVLVLNMLNRMNES